MGLGLAISDTLFTVSTDLYLREEYLSNGALASTTAHTHAVDDVALLSLVAKTTSLVWARWARCAVYNRELPVSSNLGQQAVFASSDRRTDTPSSELEEGSAAHRTASS